MAWVLAHLQPRGRDTDSSKAIFGCDIKCSVGRSDCGRARTSCFAVRSGKHQLRGGVWRRARRKLRFERGWFPRIPSKPLRAASPPRAQQARIVRLSPPLHGEASPTNHEIWETAEWSAGKTGLGSATGCPPLAAASMELETTSSVISMPYGCAPTP